MKGNRCGHNPNNPNLIPLSPIRKGKGGLPRILSLAAERAKDWYWHPKKCPPLTRSGRKIRSERREAVQVVIETILSHLDLASLCVGIPTRDHGFIDFDMRTLVQTAGISQRRFERAVCLLKDAGFMSVAQPRTKNERGEYYGLRAIRVITASFFDWLNLGPMLDRERRRATAALRRKAAQANKKLSDLIHRVSQDKPARHPTMKGADRIRWSRQWSELVLQGVEAHEAKRRTNAALGYPLEFTPGQASTNLCIPRSQTLLKP